MKKLVKMSKEKVCQSDKREHKDENMFTKESLQNKPFFGRAHLLNNI
jgi:hypothetical protein